MDVQHPDFFTHVWLEASSHVPQENAVHLLPEHFSDAPQSELDEQYPEIEEHELFLHSLPEPHSELDVQHPDFFTHAWLEASSHVPQESSKQLFEKHFSDAPQSELDVQYPEIA
ncbi:MAG: hypothetical protein ACI4PW_09595, partial [Alphaproteobacteria bacterium]